MPNRRGTQRATDAIPKEWRQNLRLPTRRARGRRYVAPSAAGMLLLVAIADWHDSAEPARMDHRGSIDALDPMKVCDNKTLPGILEGA